MASKSDLVNFFAGKTVFITGGTGFMGKVLIEKMLYTFPDLDTLYVLLRPKKGKAIDARLEEMFKLPLFGRIRAECPERLQKLVPIAGDITSNKLGLTEEDETKLISNVDIVIHGAATLRLEAKLKEAVSMNTEGTLRVLQLCTRMKHLKLMIHTSTAFCHCDVDLMEEKVYPPPHNPMDIIRLVNWMDDVTLDKITPELLHPHPNSYTYSKRIAEALVASYYPQLPTCIVRPSIVIPSWKEPLPGWVDNLNGPVGLLVGGGKGVIRSMHCNADYNAEVIPVDMAINAMLAVAMTVCKGPKQEEIPVFNLTQAKTHQITWGQILDYGKGCVLKNPFEMMLWYPNGNIHKSKAVHNINVLLFHWLPAYIIDFLLFIFGQKTFMIHVQKKIQCGLDVLQYFTTHQWRFPNAKLLAIREAMNPVDKEIFTLDFEGIAIIPYLTNTVLGARTYLLKENPKSLPRARRTLMILWILDKIMSFLFYFLILWLLVNYSESARSLLDSTLSLFYHLPFFRKQ
ncbi:putative fatty acyl-CoA reductase CG5065 [Rhodnius prolixus]|uniref:putative fatty acyl-CoA reductase CG5065 n=1 Tax=Rhodnius prolixus TaxID=13249 RepID=UPI003D18945E